MASSTNEQAEVDALIAQLSSTTTGTSPEKNAIVSERKCVYIRQNSGSTSSTQSVGSPTDAHKYLLQKNAKLSKKNDRKSRQGKGRGLAKKQGGGGHFTWGALGSELIDEFAEELDDDDLDDWQYNQAKEKYLTEASAKANHRDGLKSIENFEKEIKPIIDEYFLNGDANDVAQSLHRFDWKQSTDGELLAYIITIALEKSNVYKELVSRLLHDLYGIMFRTNDYTNGYKTLLTTLNDLSLDNPECCTDLGKFIARSIADKCIDNSEGKYFADFKGSVACPKMQAALDKAETLVLMGDFYFLNNVWGVQSSGFRPVRELADKMNVMIHEYYDSGDVNETIRSLKELNVPHFFHEFVYELIDFCLEKNTERAQQLTIILLEKLTSTTIITYDQLKTGMLRIFDDIDDLQLDLPNVHEQLQDLLKQLDEKKIINNDIIVNISQKGRKRLTSTDDKKSTA